MNGRCLWFRKRYKVRKEKRKGGEYGLSMEARFEKMKKLKVGQLEKLKHERKLSLRIDQRV